MSVCDARCFPLGHITLQTCSSDIIRNCIDLCGNKQNGIALMKHFRVSLQRCCCCSVSLELSPCVCVCLTVLLVCFHEEHFSALSTVLSVAGAVSLQVCALFPITFFFTCRKYTLPEIYLFVQFLLAGVVPSRVIFCTYSVHLLHGNANILYCTFKIIHSLS